MRRLSVRLSPRSTKRFAVAMFWTGTLAMTLLAIAMTCWLVCEVALSWLDAVD